MSDPGYDQVQSDFDPLIHGFSFPNRFPGGAVVAELARQDRLSDLVGSRVPRSVRHLANLAQNGDFWGTFGLCGGMSWAAIDRYHRRVPIPELESPPVVGDDLFRELVRFQADSMRGRSLIQECLQLQLLPDRTPWWLFWTKGVLEWTIEEQRITLLDSLDAGRPTALTLIRSSGLESPARHHQVVAIGYEPIGPGRIAIRLYDPNHPRSTRTLRLSADPKRPSIEADSSTGRGLRGFLVWSPDVG
jgi:hypothetical protein